MSEKKFDVVKHVKSLSRASLKVPKGKVLPSKKRKLLEKIVDREGKNLN